MQRHRILVLVLAFACMAPACPAGSQEVHSVVLQLLDPEQRQDAFAEIVSWQKYASNPPRHRETADRKILKVVVCPQKEGTPIYAVLTELSPGKDTSVITLVDGDGTMIPFYRGANVLRGELLDVNGDGVVESVEVRSISVWAGDVPAFLDELYVVPITREQRAVLNVVFQRRLTSWRPKPEWSWRLKETLSKGTHAIALGPEDPESGSIEPKAIYSWSATEERWIGPAGGFDQPFLRVEAHSRNLRRYVSAALARVVAGRVTDDEEGRPLSVARVRYRLAGQEGGSSAWSQKPMITGSRGRFQLGKLEPDRAYEIRIEKDGFAPATFEIGGKDNPTDLQIELRRTSAKPQQTVTAEKKRGHPAAHIAKGLRSILASEGGPVEKIGRIEALIAQHGETVDLMFTSAIAVTYNPLAELCLQAGQYDKALAYSDKARLLNQIMIGAIIHGQDLIRAIALAESGRDFAAAEAIANGTLDLYKQARNVLPASMLDSLRDLIEPYEGQAHLVLGLVASRKGEAATAEESLRKAYALSAAMDPQITLKLARFLDSAGHQAEALRFLAIASVTKEGVTSASASWAALARSELERQLEEQGLSAELDELLGQAVTEQRQQSQAYRQAIGLLTRGYLKGADE